MRVRIQEKVGKMEVRGNRMMSDDVKHERTQGNGGK